MFADTHDLKAAALDSPRQNLLLAALGDAAYRRVAPHLELARLPLGCVLCEAGAHVDHVYFPTTSIVSMLYDLENGTSIETAVTGNDGLVGISPFMGGGVSAERAVVRSAGGAYRMRADLLTREFEQHDDVRHLLLRYTQALMTQMAQTAVCNRCHQTEQQLCRALLFSLDRLPTNELAVTHELIANGLGVRRESVTAAAGKLQADGLIRYSRGRITVLNRRQLESRVCECYAVVKAAFERLVPHHAPPSLPVVVTRRFVQEAPFLGRPAIGARAHRPAADLCPAGIL